MAMLWSDSHDRTNRVRLPAAKAAFDDDLIACFDRPEPITHWLARLLGIVTIPNIVVEEPATPDEKEDVEGINHADEVFEQVEKEKEKEGTPAPNAAEQAQPAPKKKFTYTDDVQIVRAVDVLKAVKIYQGLKK